MGRIKHNFSVMVRGLGFSALIISSTSQSRPLSRPPAASSLSPRSRVSLYLSVSLPPVYPRSWEYISMHFPGLLASRSPFTLRSRVSSAVRPCASTVCFLPYNFRPRQSSLRPALFICLSFPRFFAFLSRALITNFSLFSRNSRSSKQLFRADSILPLPPAHVHIYRYIYFFFFLCLLFLTRDRLDRLLFVFFYPSFLRSLSDDTSNTPFSDTCSFRLRSISVKRKYTQSRTERRIGKSCNAPFSIRRLPPLSCLFIRLFNSPPASDRLRNVICQHLRDTMYPCKHTRDGETLDACSPATSFIVKIETFRSRNSPMLVPFHER